jgi:hypothetical protein
LCVRPWVIGSPATPAPPSLLYHSTRHHTHLGTGGNLAFRWEFQRAPPRRLFNLNIGCYAFVELTRKCYRSRLTISSIEPEIQIQLIDTDIRREKPSGQIRQPEVDSDPEGSSKALSEIRAAAKKAKARVRKERRESRPRGPSGRQLFTGRAQRGPKYYPEFITTVISTLQIAFPTAAIAAGSISICKAAIVKWVGNKAHRSVTIKVGEIRVEIRGDNDLEKAIQAVNQLASLQSQRGKKAKKLQARDKTSESPS